MKQNLRDTYIVISFNVEDGDDPHRVKIISGRESLLDFLKENDITNFLTEIPDDIESILDSGDIYEELLFNTLIIGNLSGKVIVPKVKKKRITKEELVIE